MAARLTLDVDENQALALLNVMGDRLADLDGDCGQVFDGEHEALATLWWRLRTWLDRRAQSKDPSLRAGHSRIPLGTRPRSVDE